jgi:hypothetical protein
MKLNSKNLRWVLIGTLILSVMLFIAIMVLGMSLLSKESKRMVELKVKSQTVDAQLSNLEQSRKDVEKYSYFKQIANSVIPNDKDQAVAILELNKMAEASGISLQSITFPASTLGSRPTATATPAQPSAASVPASKAISQAIPVTGIPGLYSLELTITPESGQDISPARQVTYQKMLDFLKRIETNRHTAQISQITITPATNSAGMTFTSSINIFIKP